MGKRKQARATDTILETLAALTDFTGRLGLAISKRLDVSFEDGLATATQMMPDLFVSPVRPHIAIWCPEGHPGQCAVCKIAKPAPNLLALHFSTKERAGQVIGKVTGTAGEVCSCKADGPTIVILRIHDACSTTIRDLGMRRAAGDPIHPALLN